MNKIVINSYCGDEFTEFDLSMKAIDWLIDHGIREKYTDIKNLNYLPRHEPLLVECIETLGRKAASSSYCLLSVIEIDDDSYFIYKDDGYENVISSKDLIKIK